MTNNTATPIGYVIMGHDDIGYVVSVHDKNKHNVFNVRIFGNGETVKNIAETIKTAVNSHEKLVDALKKVIDPETMIEEKILWAKQALKEAE